MTDASPRRARVPRHVGFPLRLDAGGRTARVVDDDYLRGLVEQVLFTTPGERVNRPDLGSGIGQLVFAPGGDALAQSTQALVQGALQRWVGDLVRVEEVRVTATGSRLEVVVAYLPLLATGPEQRRTVTVTGGGPP
jgi:phage baseplate assembly protein W